MSPWITDCNVVTGPGNEDGATTVSRGSQGGTMVVAHVPSGCCEWMVLVDETVVASVPV